jgi:hypothetical protein
MQRRARGQRAARDGSTATVEVPNEVRSMNRIEEETVTTTTTREEEPVKPHVDNLNLNINPDAGETISVNHPDEPARTRTETTHTEIHESD